MLNQNPESTFADVQVLLYGEIARARVLDPLTAENMLSS
jgi:hypothetical protein